jgi:RNA polymerase sigma-70 factor, ECF subfamily
MKSDNNPELENRFDRIFSNYGPPLQRLCSAYRRNAAEQQDLMQEIAMAIWTALPNYRGQASERTWIYRIAHNVALTFSARQTRRTAQEQPFDPTVHDPGVWDNSQRLVLMDGISQLEPIDRHLALLYLEGLSGREISEVTGMSTENIAVRVNRLKQKLASGLSGKGIESESTSRAK